jgi:hypothetical protein
MDRHAQLVNAAEHSSVWKSDKDHKGENNPQNIFTNGGENENCDV